MSVQAPSPTASHCTSVWRCKCGFCAASISFLVGRRAKCFQCKDWIIFLRIVGSRVVHVPLGLGMHELRHPDAKGLMTAAEFKWLQEHPERCPPHMKAIFEHARRGAARSASANKAVQTKREKYRVWPTRKGDHR